MNGLLRHSASIWKGMGAGLPYPTAGLDVVVYNTTYEDGGTTYLRMSTGVGVPLVSGTGLDAIWDFSVLNDLRFNKNAYVGSSYTDDFGNPLPANYNFPYVGIYYDSANPYHWKITDFHYANILAQSLLVDNMFFLKAKATTNTSNIIASWSELLIYSVTQTSDNLTKLKTYIGIQADFYENVDFPNENFELGNFTNWAAKLTEGNIQITPISNTGNYAALIERTSGSNFSSIKLFRDFSLENNTTYKISFYSRGDGVNNGFWSLYNVGLSDYYKTYTGLSNSIVYTKTEYELLTTSTSARIQFVANNNSNLALLYYDDMSIEKKYQNYYKS